MSARFVDVCCLALLAAALVASARIGSASSALRGPGVVVRERALHGQYGPSAGFDVSSADAPARLALSAVVNARALLPAELRRDVVLQLDPLTSRTASGVFDDVRAVPASRAVVVRRDVVPGLDVTVWLHELVHLAASGERPHGAVGARLAAAIDEGVADHAAATFSGGTTVGAREERRDLAAPPRQSDADWAYLGVPSAPWDAHRMGWTLAASLAREAPSRALAIDVVTSLISREPWPAADTPRAVLREWIARCPSRSREALRRAVERWAPRELMEMQEPS